MSFINPALDQAKAQTVTVPSPSPDDQFPPLSLPRSNSSPVSLVDRVALLSRPSAFKPSLKKRHSTYVLASPASPTSFRLAPPALQTMTPHRSGPPPRRPVHSIIHNPTYPAQTRPDSRPPSTTATTGTMEEVTPWELFNPPSHDGHASPKHSVDSAFLSTPLPPLASSSHIVRSSLSTGLVEDVTPWELYEPPIIEEVPEPPSKQSSTFSPHRSLRHPRSSTQGSSAARAISELALRRRRSGGNTKSSKTRSNTLPANPLPAVLPHPPPPPPSLPSSSPLSQHSRIDVHPGDIQLKTPSKSTPTTPRLGPTPATNAPPLPHTLPIQAQPTASSSTAPIHPATIVTPAKSSDTFSAPKFSTADRTILEELRRNIIAREAHFVFKGPGLSASGVRVGKKHHSYPRKEVPYPRNFEREVLDLDVWETVFTRDICHSLTWHVFDKPPTKVLDLGCGTGTWLLNCARAWRDCHFVGLDVVPLQPDLQRVGSQDLASRITWIQANFLEGLPFPNDEFDFVHMKRVALGVPEDKWDFLLEEVTRVMKPGAAFEMLEEDLFFPGKQFDDEDSTSEYDGYVNDQISEHSHDMDAPAATPTNPHIPPTPTTEASTVVPSTPSRSNSPHPTSIRENTIAEDEEKESLKHPDDETPPPVPPKTEVIQPQPTPPTYVTLIPPHSRSASRPPIRAKTPSNPTNPLHLNVAHTKFANSAVSLISSLSGSTGEGPTSGGDAGKNKRRRSGVEHPQQTGSQSIIAPSSPTSSMQGRPHSSSSKIPPFLLRTMPKQPPNPRDHSLLETIYTEMLASRFINPAPLSILANTLQLHFKDVRTHAPVQFSFPPPPGSMRSQKAPAVDDQDNDSDDARDAHIPLSERPRRLSRASSKGTGQEETEEHRWLSMQNLMQRDSPYISLDDSRNSAFSPALKVSVLLEPINPVQASGPAARAKSKMRFTSLSIDVRTLNLHLACRTAEIVGCAESMWEWVQEYQEEVHDKKGNSKASHAIRRNRSGSLEAMAHQSLKKTGPSVLTNASGNVTEAVRTTLADLTREEFDDHLRRFQMDMQDHMALASELRDRFSWNVTHKADIIERKAFQDACEKWEQWEAERRRNQLRHRASNSVSTSATAGPNLESVPQDINQDSMPSHPKWLRRTHSNLEAHAAPSLSGLSTSPNLRSLTESSPSPTGVHRSSHLRLSRAMRVFVAWKASEP